MEAMKPMQPMKPMTPMEPMKGQAPWWPENLGSPTTTGSENDLRYAYFADSGRLAVSRNGSITIHDTAGHQITGVAQHQGDGQGDGGIRFSSSDGEIPLASLPVCR